MERLRLSEPASTPRERLDFKLEFECKSIAGWAYRVSVSQMWRVFPEYDLEDLMGEAQLAYVKILKKYPECDNMAHFSALFRMTFQNHITNIANRRSKKVGINLTDVMAGTDSPDLDSIAAKSHDGGIAALALRAQEAPPRIRELLQAFVTGPENGEEIPKQRYTISGHRRVREPINEFLCRVAGVDAGIDLANEVLDWIRYGESSTSPV